MPDAEKIIAEALEAAGVERGYVGASFFRAHFAKHVAAALREAGMLTETEWEYRAEGRNRMGHMEMRNRVEAGVIPTLVRRGYVAYRRRPSVPAGLWEPVPTEGVSE